MHDILELVISNFAQLSFSIDVLLMYAGLIITSTVLFYVIDTPWRKRRNADAARQKARNAAMLETLKAKTIPLKKTRYINKYEQYLRAKQERHDQVLRKAAISYAKKLQKEHRHQIDVEKRITEEALYRAEVQRQALIEVVGEKQAALTKIDLDSIKQQIHAELLAATQHAANCELTDEIVNAICAPRVGFIVGI